MADLSIGGKIIESALKAYDYLNDRKSMPTNRRVFLETVLDNNRNDITERDLSPQELRGLSELITNKYKRAEPELGVYRKYIDAQMAKNADAIKRKARDQIMYPEFSNAYSRDAAAIDALKAGRVTPELIQLLHQKKRDYYSNYGLKEAFKGNMPELDIAPNIQYEDYKDANAGRRLAGEVKPQESLSTLLGRFNFDVDKSGTIRVKDSYDFNPSTNVITQTPTDRKVSTENLVASPDFGPNTLYNELRAYAGEKLPPGSGRNVNITINPRTLQELFRQE